MASRDHDWFVGEMGLTFESDGFTRIGGRLFGHLLLADRPLSLDELAEALGASKASVSTDARRLLEKGVERWRRLDALVGELKRRSPTSSAAVRARLRYMEDVYAYIAGRVDDALESWQSRHTPKPRRARASAKPHKRGRAA